MKCPVDNTDLVMSDRQGIEIDYCPQCRGVWLDRGEIDKIVERSTSAGYGPAPAAQQAYPQPQPQHSGYQHQPRRDYDDDDHHYDQGHHQSGHNQHHKRKESWFGELFD